MKKGLRRVHVDKLFALVFEIIEFENKILFSDFAHYNDTYKTYNFLILDLPLSLGILKKFDQV